MAGLRFTLDVDASPNTGITVASSSKHTESVSYKSLTHHSKHNRPSEGRVTRGSTAPMLATKLVTRYAKKHTEIPGDKLTAHKKTKSQNYTRKPKPKPTDRRSVTSAHVV